MALNVGEFFQAADPNEYNDLFAERVRNEQLVEEPDKLYVFMAQSASGLALRATAGVSDLERITVRTGEHHLVGSLHIKDQDSLTRAVLSSHFREGEWQPARLHEHIRTRLGLSRLALARGYLLERSQLDAFSSVLLGHSTADIDRMHDGLQRLLDFGIEASEN